MPLNLIFIQPGTYTIDDNGIPGRGRAGGIGAGHANRHEENRNQRGDNDKPAVLIDRFVFSHSLFPINSIN